MNNEDEPVAMRFVFGGGASRTSTSTSASTSSTSAIASANTSIMGVESMPRIPTSELEDGEATPRATRLALSSDSVSSPTTPTSPSPTVSASGSGSAAGDVELVPIKPRPRARRRRTQDTSRSGGDGSAGSAFGGTPPGAGWDPAWNTTQLRVEGGQLRDRRDGNKPCAPLLPKAFRPEPELTASQRAALALAGTGARPGVGTNAAARHTIVVKGAPGEAANAIAAVLKESFDARDVVPRANEVRATVNICTKDRLLVVDVKRSTTATAGTAASGTELAFRRSLVDRTTLDMDDMQRWVDDVRSIVEELQE